MDSVNQYASLQDFAGTVSALCGEEAASNEPGSVGLVTFLENIRDRTWLDMKAELSK